MAVTAPVAGTNAGSNGIALSTVIIAGQGVTTGDIVVIFAVFYSQSGTAPTAITWPGAITNLPAFTQGRLTAIRDAGGVQRGVAGWAWSRATGTVTTPANLTVSSNGTTGASSGAHAQNIRVRGCVATGDPWEAETVNAPNHTTTLDWPAATMSRSTGGMSCVAFCHSDNVNVGNSASWTALVSNASTQGLDSAIDIDYRIPGATGTYDPANGTVGASNALGWAAFHIMFTDTAGGPTAYTLDCQPATYTFTPAQAGLARGLFIDAAPAAYALTPADAGFPLGRALNAQPASYAFTPFAAEFGKALSLNAEPASFSFTAFAAGLNVGRTLSADPAAYSLSAFDADLVYDPGAGGVAYELNAEPATYDLTAFQAGLAVGRVLNAEPAAFAFTPASAGVNAQRVLNAQPAAYAVTAFDASFQRAVTLRADPASYIVTAFEAGLVIPTGDTYRIPDFATCEDAVAAGWRIEYTHMGTYWLAEFEKYLNPREMNISVLPASPGSWPVRHYGVGQTQEEACQHALRSLNSWRDNRYDIAPHPITQAPIGGHTVDLT